MIACPRYEVPDGALQGDCRINPTTATDGKRGSHVGRYVTKDIAADEYPPSEDTFFLADYIEHNVRPGGRGALDVGSGSGYITRMLTGMFDLVVGTDINFDVLSKQNPAYRTEHIVCCSGSDALSARFEVAVCNPPYLATDDITHIATDGGPGGLAVPALLLDSVRCNIKDGGSFLIVSTSLSDYKGIIKHALHAGFADARIVSRKRLFFEELLLIECTMGTAPDC